jgi:murein DD-endopeptidase MepM/ murein hydrolase activator NlpD
MRQRVARLAFIAAVLTAASFVAFSATHGTEARAGVFDTKTLPARVQRLQTLSYDEAAAPVRRLAHRHARHEGRTLTAALSFSWPAEGTITTPFIPGRHDGIDIGSLRSLTVTAAHGGRVLHVGYTTGFEGYGNIVDVEVAPGVETLYAHLSAMNVQIGDEVHEGQVLGTAGCTGLCSGTHLHFEVRVDGTPVDPLHYLR